MNKWYLGTGLAGLLFCLIAYIPAPLLYHWLRDDWGNQVQVYGVGGYLWRGHAARVNLAGIELQSVEWRWRPQALLIGRFSRTITAQTAGGTLQAVVSNPVLGNRLTISHARGSLPVEQLGQVIGFSALPFSGMLRLELERLQLRNGQLWLAEGSGDVDNLSFNFSTPPAVLGNYHAELDTRDQVVQLLLTTTAGHVEADGSGRISREGQYELSLKLRPRATAPASVANLLQALGKPDAEGWHLLNRKGQL